MSDAGSMVDGLWSGILNDLRLDLALHVVCFDIRTIEGSDESLHRLICSGVSDFRWTTDDRQPWNYVEVTAVTLRRIESGDFRLELVTWTEESRIEVTCTDVRVSELGSPEDDHNER
jgi:hypothetical protein